MSGLRSTPSGSLVDDRRYDYMNEQVGFWRSLWLVLRGRRLRELVTYQVTEDFDPEGGLREIWTRVKA